MKGQNPTPWVEDRYQHWPLSYDINRGEPANKLTFGLIFREGPLSASHPVIFSLSSSQKVLFRFSSRAFYSLKSAIWHTRTHAPTPKNKIFIIHCLRISASRKRVNHFWTTTTNVQFTHATVTAGFDRSAFFTHLPPSCVFFVARNKNGGSGNKRMWNQA